MSHNSEFTDYVLDQLESVGVNNTARMFSGTLLKVGPKQLGVVIMDTLYFKVTEPELQQRFREFESEQFTYGRKDRNEPVVIKNWWSVPEEIVDDREQLVALACAVLLQGS